MGRTRSAKDLSKVSEQNAVLSRKRKGDQDVDPASRPKSVKPSQIQKGKTVKRKINFDAGSQSNEEQANNNATVNVNKTQQTVASGTKVGPAMTRSKNSKETNSNFKELKANETQSSRVQWTKEFMDKVRKSHKKLAEKSANRGKQPLAKTKIVSVLLNDVQVQEGDGIEIHVDQNGFDDKELDYDDNLLLEDDEPVLIQEMRTEVAEATIQPGTSMQQTVNVENLTEEQLQGNPVIQKMMEKFFKENFQKMQ